MSYDLLIHEYLDTGLDEARQEALFAEIAKNPELRNEFNSQLKLQNISNVINILFIFIDLKFLD